MFAVVLALILPTSGGHTRLAMATLAFGITAVVQTIAIVCGFAWTGLGYDYLQLGTAVCVASLGVRVRLRTRARR